MLDPTNPDVLSWIRIVKTGEPATIVAMNFTAEPKTVSLDLGSSGVKGTQVKTLLTDAPSLEGTETLQNITLPPFASWIAEVR
jgi:alpha-glucosidase